MVSWGSWREDTIIGAIGVWLVNIRVRDQRQALICGTCEACSLWLRQEIKMESFVVCLFTFLDPLLHLVKILVKFIQWTFDELLINFWLTFDELLMKCEWNSIKKISVRLPL